VGSTPAARTSLFSGFRWKSSMESIISEESAFSNRLGDCRLKMDLITIKPEQKPEHLAELGKWDFRPSGLAFLCFGEIHTARRLK
jgi:hypothetical protein